MALIEPNGSAALGVVAQFRGAQLSGCGENRSATLLGRDCVIAPYPAELRSSQEPQLHLSFSLRCVPSRFGAVLLRYAAEARAGSGGCLDGEPARSSEREKREKRGESEG